MSAEHAAHVHNRRAASAAQLEALRDIRQAPQTIIRMLEELASGQRELMSRISAKNRGGHPVTYDWDAVRRAIMRHANLHRFDTRAELRKVATDFIEQKCAANGQGYSGLSDAHCRGFIAPLKWPASEVTGYRATARDNTP